MKSRYKLEPSREQERWWVLTDVELRIVLRFADGRYNETQRVTFLDDEPAASLSPDDVARAMREMGEYMMRHHGSVAFAQPYGYEVDEDTGDTYLYRRKYPRWRLRIDPADLERLIDGGNRKGLPSSLRKAAEWLEKSSHQEDI